MTRKSIYRKPLHHRSRHSMMALAFVVSGLSLTGAAQAQHNYDILRAKADAVFHSMIALDQVYVRDYVRSREFGEMMAKSGQIKAKAAYLRGMSYFNSPCQWTQEIDRLDRMVHQLEDLVASAHFRADRGLDPAISFCAIEARQRLAAIVDLIHCMSDALNFGTRAPIYQPNYRVPSPPVVIHDHYGHGHRGHRGHDRGRRGGHRNDFGGVQVSGRNGGSVQFDQGGITIGRGGVGFRIKF